MDDMIYRNDSAARQRINLKNGARKFPNGQTSAIKSKK